MHNTNFFRNISFLSIIAVIFLPLFTYIVLYPSFTSLLIKSAEEEALSIGRHLSSMYLWRESEVKSSSVTDKFKNEVQQVMKEFTIIKIKMFSSSGEIIFSTDSREIGEINKRSYFHEIVAGGDTYTQLVKKDTKTLEDKIITADVVETYVPIMNNKKFIGAFELYYDISERKEALDKLVFASFVIVFIIVCVLLVAIVFSLMKAKRAITGLNLAEEQLKALSFSDELTCLHNRRGFYNLAEPLYNVAMRRNQGAFMLYADLDHLKLINDLIGHHAGDIVLKRTAEVLKDTFRGTDIIARLGGDEFAVFGVTVPGLNIEILDSRLKKNITFNNEKTDQPLTDISLSYGFAINDPQDPSSIDGLLAKADGLMYEVKKKKE